MIHTDFKPENVNISLRDDEVDEISRTGQLTTTKMGKNDGFRKMNMKVAGTLGNYLSQRVDAKTGELIDAEDKKKGDASPSKSEISELDSECKSIITDNEENKEMFKGLTKQQKKNLRKKLVRKRKRDAVKAESESKSALDSKFSQEDDEESTLPKGAEIDDIDIDIGSKKDKDDVPADAPR